MSGFRALQIGEPAPWFVARCTSGSMFHFDTIAGRFIVLAFFGSAADPISRRLLDAFLAQREAFDDHQACFFGVSIDPEDESSGRVRESLPGFRHFWDFDREVSRKYFTLREERPDTAFSRQVFVLDCRLRILDVVPVHTDPEGIAQHVVALLQQQPAFGPPSPAIVQAPVLVVPRIFEPQLCQTLMHYYDQNGGEDSGFMRDVSGRTVHVLDPTFKKRRDQVLEDENLRRACMVRIHDRLVPEIAKAFQFKATRIERYIVACYDAHHGGYFRPHRDNTTLGTAHRRFAVSLNLNTGEYEGGQLRFPEFGPQLYTPPAGGAVVFSCSLLHEATPVTSGRRYVFLPFLYDEEAARLRQHNAQFVG